MNPIFSTGIWSKGVVGKVSAAAPERRFEEDDRDDGLQDTRHYGWREIGRRFRPLVRPHRWRLAAAGGLVCLVGVAVSLQPLFAKFVIDEAIPRRDVRLALAAAGVFLAIMFLRMALWFVAMTLVYRTQQGIVFELRSASFSHLQKLCLKYHGRFPAGFIYERVFGSSINVLGAFMHTVFSTLVTYAVGLVFSLWFCVYLNPLLTLVILSGAVLYALSARALSRRIYLKTRESTEAGMHIVNVIMDKLRGVRTIQSFAIEERVQEEFTRQLWPAMMKWMASVLESLKLGFVTEGLGYVLTATVVVGGAWLVIADGENFALGTLVAFMGYQGTLIGMINAMTNIYGQFMGARSAFDQLFTVLDTHSTVVEQPGAVMPAPIEPRLSFRDVTFAYEDRPVLHGVNLDVPPRKTTALVGRSGSGKTTLANLMVRFYDPTDGAILLDGHNIRELPLREYRSLFGVVLQDPFLFDASILSNLRTIRPDATDADLEMVLRAAGAWEFVEQFPERLRYRVGEGGGRLSGGQRQRLAIARCLLTHSRFVILDEATSALDPESEGIVKQGIEALCRDRTVVVIAHRLGTIRNADNIVVMDDGLVAEQGTFEELIARGGVFARLHAIAVSDGAQRAKLDQAGFV